MKILIAIFVMFCGGAYADSFTVIRDGQEYLCSPTSSNNPIGAQECAEAAYRGPFNREESLDLCSGARSRAPADCGIKAYSGAFNKTESVQLCKRGNSVGPAECGLRAYSGPFNKDESVRLCTRTGSIAVADCALRAYAGPYNKEESINLCRSNNAHLMLKALAQLPVNQEKLKEFKSLDVLRGIEK